MRDRLILLRSHTIISVVAFARSDRAPLVSSSLQRRFFAPSNAGAAESTFALEKFGRVVSLASLGPSAASKTVKMRQRGRGKARGKCGYSVGGEGGREEEDDEGDEGWRWSGRGGGGNEGSGS
jgi:hypothetical protein